MDKAVRTSQPAFYAELQELKTLEDRVAQKISPTLLDYLFLLAPDVKYNIAVKDLNKDDEKLLEDYIRLADALLDKLNMPKQDKSSSNLETFLSRIHDMYLLRFIDARALYYEYALYRIPTQFELNLQERSMGAFQLPKGTTRFLLDKAFVTDETGAIDWAKTTDRENKEHVIGKYIAAYKNAKMQKDQMFVDLQAITTRGFAFMLIDRELKELANQVLIEVFAFFGGEVYKYINRGYSLEEAVSNVYEMYKPAATKSKDTFVRTVKPLFDQIKKLLNDTFDTIKEMNKITREMIIDDYIELIIAYFKDKQVFPRDYYQASIRDYQEYFTSEQNNNYEKVIDFRMYVPEGGVTQMALETFYVDFTEEAKVMIFKSMIGKIENPMFTLDHYLRKKELNIDGDK